MSNFRFGAIGAVMALTAYFGCSTLATAEPITYSLDASYDTGKLGILTITGSFTFDAATGFESLVDLSLLFGRLSGHYTQTAPLMPIGFDGNPYVITGQSSSGEELLIAFANALVGVPDPVIRVQQRDADGGLGFNVPLEGYATPVPAPEPASLTLLGTGAMVLGFSVRRRRQLSLEAG